MCEGEMAAEGGGLGGDGTSALGMEVEEVEQVEVEVELQCSSVRAVQWPVSALAVCGQASGGSQRQQTTGVRQSPPWSGSIIGPWRGTLGGPGSTGA